MVSQSPLIGSMILTIKEDVKELKGRIEVAIPSDRVNDSHMKAVEMLVDAILSRNPL